MHRIRDAYFFLYYAFCRLGPSMRAPFTRWNAMLLVCVLEILIVLTCDEWIEAVTGAVTVGQQKTVIIGIFACLVFANYWALVRSAWFDAFADRIAAWAPGRRRRALAVTWIVIGAIVAVLAIFMNYVHSLRGASA